MNAEAAVTYKGTDTAKPTAGIGIKKNTLVRASRTISPTGLKDPGGSGIRNVDLYVNGKWHMLAKDAEPPAETSLLAAREPITAKKLRVKIGAVPGKPPMIRRLRLLPPDRTMTPQRR